jgi:hypothetical protein
MDYTHYVTDCCGSTEFSVFENTSENIIECYSCGKYCDVMDSDEFDERERWNAIAEEEREAKKLDMARGIVESCKETK